MRKTSKPAQKMVRAFAALLPLLLIYSSARAADSITITGVQEDHSGFAVKGDKCTFLSNGPAGIGKCYELDPGERRGSLLERPIGVNVPEDGPALPANIGKFVRMEFTLVAEDDDTLRSLSNLITYLQDTDGFIHTIGTQQYSYQKLGITDGYSQYIISTYANFFTPVVEAKAQALAITYGPVGRSGEIIDYIANPIVEGTKGSTGAVNYKTENSKFFNVDTQ